MNKLGPVLLRQAAKDSWANPHVDDQFLIEPRRVTPKTGARGAYRLPHMAYVFPESTKTFVLYEFGQIDPAFLGFNDFMLDWRSLNTICAEEEMFANAFVNHRMVLPHTVWIKRTNNRNLLIAVEYDPNKEILTQVDDRFFIRLYSNAWYVTTAGRAADGIKVGSAKVTELTDASALISGYNTANLASKGFTLWYHNGFYSEKPLMGNVKKGDSISYIWDSSGINYFDVPLTDLASYLSTMDRKNKLAVLSPEYIHEEFHYYDDLEFYICSKTADGTIKGVYYDKYAYSDIRQLTHRDWALDANRVTSLIHEQNGVLVYKEAFVRVFVRNATTPSRLVADGNYLHDFYDVDYSNRRRILAGTLSGVGKWKADVLENASYMRWLSRRATELTEANVKNVYSYYGAQKILQTPKHDGTSWTLPEAARDGCFVLGMNSVGKLIHSESVYPGAGGDMSYIPPTSVTDIIVYCGSVITEASIMDSTVQYDNDKVDDFDEERYYQSVGTTTPTVATAGVDYDYDIKTGKCAWVARHINAKLYKRQARFFTTREFRMPFATVGTPVDIFEGGSTPITNDGFGHVDIWLDGNKAVPGLDYHHNGFKLWITNQEYLDRTVPAASNKGYVTVRMVAYGLPKDKQTGQFGFVVDGMVNHNNKVDMTIRRNQNFYLNGNKRTTEGLVYAENYRGEQTLTFTQNVVTQWLESTAYVKDALVEHDYILYMAPVGGVKANVIFTSADWIRIYSEQPYSLNDTAKTHYNFFESKGKLMMCKLYANGTKLTGSALEDAVLNVPVSLQAGLPPSTVIPEGALYYFEQPGNSINRFKLGEYTESYQSAGTTDKAISALLGKLRPQKTFDGVTTIANQHGVVSITLVMLIGLIQKGDLKIQHNNMSDVAIDFIMKQYASVIAADVCKADLDFRFVEVYAHGRLGRLGLGAWEVSFLERVNQIYLGGRVVTNRDLYIV